jgi:Sortase domain
VFALRDASKPKPILETTNATLPEAPRTTLVPTTVTAPTSSVATTVPTLSPLATLVGRSYDVRPEPITTGPLPVSVDLAGVVINGRVRPIGLEPSGELEIPDESEIGWYRLGSRPGQPGATVLAAHVSWNGALGPFARLGAVEPGTELLIRLDDGTTRTYEVTERAQYDKTSLPENRIWTRDGDEMLVLITCGGAFNPNIRRYLDNIVLFARPKAQ